MMPSLKSRLGLHTPLHTSAYHDSMSAPKFPDAPAHRPCGWQTHRV